MNILITSIGRRSYIASYFKDALKKIGGGKVFGVNVDPVSSAIPFLDGFAVAPPIYDENYIPFLVDFCVKNEVSLIVPVFDIDLPVLAENREIFHDNGIFVLVSDLPITKLCSDKLCLSKFLSENEISDIKTFTSISLAKSTLQYPILVKPRCGMGSLETYIAEDEAELAVFAKKSERELRKNYLRFESEKFSNEEAIVFQEFIDGKEFGLDVISDLSGNYITTIVKEKLRMRSGETDAAIVIKNEMLENLGENLHKALSKLGKVIGNIDCDVIVKNNIPYVIDVNARFGGGYPFSHEAGADLPLAIVSWLNNIPVKKDIFDVKYGEVWCKAIFLVKLKVKSKK